jgi:hypothetical protein
MLGGGGSTAVLQALSRLSIDFFMHPQYARRFFCVAKTKVGGKCGAAQPYTCTALIHLLPYFNAPGHLLPSLVTICVGHDRNTQLLQMEVSTQLLLQYLEKGQAEVEVEGDCNPLSLSEAEQRAALDYFKNFT